MILKSIIFLFICYQATACYESFGSDIDSQRYESLQRKNRQYSQTTRSDIRAMPVQLFIEIKEKYRYPEPVVVRVQLTDENPVLNAYITGIVKFNSEKEQVVFSENALLHSNFPDSGVYSAVLPVSQDGMYSLTVTAQSGTSSGENSDRSFSLTKEKKFQLQGYSDKKRVPPVKIDTLYAEIDSEGNIILSWIVPLNIGDNGSFEIRYSSRRIGTIEDWNSATAIVNSKYHTEGGELCRYKHNIEDKGLFYYAVVSFNKEGSRSEVSNNYIVNTLNNN